MSPIEQRAARLAQAKHRGSVSHKTELENTLIILAWESANLSEGQCARMLDLDRVALRKLRMDTLDRAMKFAEELDAPYMAALRAKIAARAAALAPAP